MKQVIRRGSRGRIDGFCERIIWMLSKEPLTSQELAGRLKIPHKELIKRMPALFHERKSYQVIAGEWFVNNKGEREREFRLVRINTDKSIAKTKIKQSLTISNYGRRNEKNRERNRKMAKARARLIKSGKYSDAEEINIRIKR
ncbi:hypothetical protein [Serratia rhizosphaerae]|uniref:Uncharacterized protein n=1 Tax=Serratia rhizosphaerae TaxID=2597702 RepID=A0ABX6GTE4_9GAMM|nr:hypothetical protein [Serratia rhizosphaerae]QHA89552.1 hypothetical protein FO014_22615 [Serratia rhizosphaerae]